MASTKSLGINGHLANEKAVAVVMKRGTPERQARLREMDPAAASPRNPQYLATFHGQLIAALAEIVEAQHVRIARLENPAAPAAAVHPLELTEVLNADLAEALQGAGYEDTNSVAEAPDEDLLDVKGIGPAKLEEIREAVGYVPEATETEEN